MPDENLLSTLEQSLRGARATRSRLASRLADLEAEAERVRTEVNEMDALVSQTEAAMFRLISSSFGVAANAAPSDAEIESALRRDAAANAPTANSQPLTPPRPATPMPSAPPPRLRPQSHVPHHIPALRTDVVPTSDRFADRTIPQAATLLLRESAGPLHVNELYNRLLEGSFQFTGQNPTISIAVSLNRNRRFRKVAPGTFDLVIRDAAQAS